MSETKPASPSSARIAGDDLQHLVVWYWCLKACAPGSGITSVGVEVDGVGNLDDVEVALRDGSRCLIQVKASVAASGVVNLDWLTASGDKSLIKRLYESWCQLDRPDEGIVLLTSRPIDPNDPLMRHRDRLNHLGSRLRRERSPAGRAVREALTDNIGCSEAELLDFLDVLEIQLGQTEKDWREKVDDVALGAGVRPGAEARAIALAEVREWVKTTRSVRDVETLRSTIDRLGLRVGEPRPVVVVQAIDHVADTSDAVHAIDWVDQFRGTTPETRRGLVDPSGWNGRLAQDLDELRGRLRGLEIDHVTVRGAMRLPVWFAVGAALREVAGFDVAALARGKLWTTGTGQVPPRQVRVLTDEVVNHTGSEVVFVVEISSIGRHDVADTFRQRPEIGRLVAVTIEDGPNARLLHEEMDAMAAAVAVRDWARQNLRVSKLHLILVASGPFALFLGHQWDRVPPTTIYEDLILGYEAAFTTRN